MAESNSIDSNLAGYRVMRRIATGSRADVFLGAGSTGTVVLKAFREHVERADVGTELDALGRLNLPHVVSLLDVSTGDDRPPIIVLERVSRGSVAQLFRNRNVLELGEAITLLAPLAATVPLLHAEGVAHTAISASTVHLGANGQPVILGFGRAAIFSPGRSVAFLDSHSGAAADREAIAALSVKVLERVLDAGAPGIRRLIDWLHNESHRFEFGSELERRLFDLAEPQPIEFGRDAMPPRAVRVSVELPVGHLGTIVGSQTVGAAPAVANSGTVADSGTVAELVEAPAPTKLPDWLDALLVKSPLDAIRQRAQTIAKGVRRRYWVIAGAVVLALILAVSIVPSGQTATPPAAAAIATPSSMPIPTEQPLPADPLAALPLLLEARNTCVRDLSVLCLDEVDEASSGAYLSDAAAIRQLEAGGTAESSVVITGAEPKLVERLGDTVLLDLGGKSDPASVLMIKTEAGWRIRDFLSGKQATP